MPPYFFNVGQELSSRPSPLDRDRTEFASAQAARVEAIVFAGQMLKDLDGAFWDGGDWRLRVTDETGATVCTLWFSGTRGGGRGLSQCHLVLKHR